jgi:hypothetical protein
MEVPWMDSFRGHALRFSRIYVPGEFLGHDARFQPGLTVPIINTRTLPASPKIKMENIHRKIILVANNLFSK